MRGGDERPVIWKPHWPAQHLKRPADTGVPNAGLESPPPGVPVSGAGGPGGLTEAAAAETGVGPGRGLGLVTLQDLLHQLLDGELRHATPVAAGPLDPVNCGQRAGPRPHRTASSLQPRPTEEPPLQDPSAPLQEDSPAGGESPAREASSTGRATEGHQGGSGLLKPSPDPVSWGSQRRPWNPTPPPTRSKASRPLIRGRLFFTAVFTAASRPPSLSREAPKAKRSRQDGCLCERIPRTWPLIQPVKASVIKRSCMLAATQASCGGQFRRLISGDTAAPGAGQGGPTPPCTRTPPPPTGLTHGLQLADQLFL